jgi:hypothetical protein
MHGTLRLFDTPEARAAEHRRLTREVEAMTRSGGAARLAAIATLRRGLLEFLRRAGVGAEFQSIDLTAWLDETGAVPAGVDLRVLGGMLVALRNRGLIRQLGYRPNGGCPARRINSGARPVYRVESLDFKGLGWEGDA